SRRRWSRRFTASDRASNRSRGWTTAPSRSRRSKPSPSIRPGRRPPSGERCGCPFITASGCARRRRAGEWSDSNRLFSRSARFAVTSPASSRLRSARLSEVDELNTLVRESVRGLSAADYSPEQLASSLEHLFGIDTRLIEDGTYYVIEENGRPI